MEPAAETKMTLSQFGLYVRCKKDLYQLALKNGYFLPKESSSIITESYLMSVIKGQCWCPKFKDVRLLPCPRPPLKNDLVNKVVMAAQEMGHGDIGVDESRLPDVKWLVDVLATLKPDDAIFKKDYVPPPKKLRQRDQHTVALPAELFEGMPLSQSKVKAKRLKIVSEAQAMEKVESLKLRQKDLSVALLEQQIRLEKLKMEANQTASKKGQMEEQKRNGAGSTTFDLKVAFKAPTTQAKSSSTPMTGITGAGIASADTRSSSISASQPQSANVQKQ